MAALSFIRVTTFVHQFQNRDIFIVVETNNHGVARVQNVVNFPFAIWPAIVLLNCTFNSFAFDT